MCLSTQEEHCLHLHSGRFRCKENFLFHPLPTPPSAHAPHPPTPTKKRTELPGVFSRVELSHLIYDMWRVICGFRDIGDRKDHLVNLVDSNRWKELQKGRGKGKCLFLFLLS